MSDILDTIIENEEKDTSSLLKEVADYATAHNWKNWADHNYFGYPHPRIINKDGFMNVIHYIASMEKALENQCKIIEELEDRTDSDIFVELNKQIEELKKENSQLRRENRMSITKEEYEKAQDFWYEHTKDFRKQLKEQHKLMPKASHIMEYVLHPSPVGLIKMAKCSCGEFIDLTGDL